MNQLTDTLTLSNPRRLYVAHNWPSGSKRVTREFGIQIDDAGRERALTWTTGKPKYSCWYRDCRIVNGSDGKTYVVGFKTYNAVPNATLKSRVVNLIDANMNIIDVGDPQSELFRVILDLINQSNSKPLI